MNMMIKDLEPQTVWDIFREITRIPRCSGHEQRLQNWVEEWSEGRGISHQRDEVGNILLSKKAARGCEDYPVLTFQVHQDMVCEKDTGSTHNFETDPIDLQIKEGYITAKGTSLGADNGIGIALAMAALVNPETAGYGKLEVLMTVEEETTFRGASNVKKGFFTGKKMVNLDSEESGVIIVESAGGLGTEYRFKAPSEVPGDWIGKRLEVDGLLGGHSGVDINLPRANAIKLISEGLTTLAGCSKLRICRFEGGTRVNAIPRSAICDFLVPRSASEKLNSIFRDWSRKARSKYGYEEGLIMELKDCSPSESIPEAVSINIIKLINDFPQGVIKLSDKIEGLVQTSSNIGVIRTKDETVTFNILSRSSDNKDLETLSGELKSLGEKYGAETIQRPPSHGWSTPPSIPFVKFTAQKYREVSGKEPKITGIHGGLECSQFASLDPEIQIVSIGATLEYPHSPRERLQISSVPVLWSLLKAMIRDAKQVDEIK
jgi:dipeptidase D